MKQNFYEKHKLVTICVYLQVLFHSSYATYCNRSQIQVMIATEIQKIPADLSKDISNFTKQIMEEIHEEIKETNLCNKSFKLIQSKPSSKPLINFRSNSKNQQLFSLTTESFSQLSDLFEIKKINKKLSKIQEIYESSRENFDSLTTNYTFQTLNLVGMLRENLAQMKTEFFPKKDLLKSLHLGTKGIIAKLKCTHANSSSLKHSTQDDAQRSTIKLNENIEREETAYKKYNGPPRDCHEAFSRGYKASGITVIQPNEKLEPQEVWCNHSWGGGGWTVILRRQPQKFQLDFRRPLSDYENGFGNPIEEYWIGLRALHHITTRQRNELLVVIGVPGESAYALYNKFKVGEGDGYRIRVSGYNKKSTAGDSLSYHDKMLFSTYDYDRDMDPSRSCSVYAGGGGFWYNFCYHANPTGMYPPKELPKDTALHTLIEWRRWKGFHTFLSHLTIMIRPHFR